MLKNGLSFSPKRLAKPIYNLKRKRERKHHSISGLYCKWKNLPTCGVVSVHETTKGSGRKHEWMLGKSESGWMKGDVFYEYIANDFNNWLTIHSIKKPVILFIDGYKSHMTVTSLI
ncbi:hypothetical protein JTB14_022410 [Gonioctena quinquepunctata]|nr:hypothetical protein JTB14_022410 [Gonioctena quinquepunctata]